VQGHNPDEDPKPSRSEWQFDVSCSLARCGVPDDLHLRILLVRDLGVGGG
jgi:hypothetical protein